MADKNILPVPAVHLQPGNLPTRNFLQQISISNSRVIDFLRAYHLLDQHEDARNCTWCIVWEPMFGQALQEYRMQSNTASIIC